MEVGSCDGAAFEAEMQRDLLTTDQGDVFQKEPIIRLRSRSGVSRTAPQLRENWWPALKIAARCCSLTTCRSQRGLPDKIRTPPEVTGLHLLMCIVRVIGLPPRASPETCRQESRRSRIAGLVAPPTRNRQSKHALDLEYGR